MKSFCLNTLDKLVHNCRAHSIWSLHFFVHKEALEDCIAGEAEYAHEHGSDNEALEGCDNAWTNPVVGKALEWLIIV